MFKYVLILFSFVYSVAICHAEEVYIDPLPEVYKQGETAEKEGEPRKAFALYQDAATQGNRHAQFRLGLMYARGGPAAKRDYAKAREWLYKSSMLGNPHAQYYLGEIYASGDGVKKDYEEALVWFWLSTSLNNKYARSRMRALNDKSGMSMQQMGEAKLRVDELWKKIPHDLKVKGSMALH